LPRLTISYRRDDSGVITGRIFDRLAAHFGRDAVFRDIDNIPAGADFRKHINAVLDETDVVLAIIGPKWIGPRSGQNRLAKGSDPVRVEIEAALRKELPLIPVLVLRAAMPNVELLPETLHSFAYRNALSLDAGQDFDIHMTRLIRSIEATIDPDMPVREPAPTPMRRKTDGRGATPEAPDLSAQNEALRQQIEALRQQLEAAVAEQRRLEEREKMFEIELRFSAEEAATMQHQTDSAAFAATVATAARSHARRMIAYHLTFTFLTVTVVGLCITIAAMWH